MDIKFMIGLFPVLLKGAAMTMELTCLSMLFGMVIGLGLALARISRSPLLNKPASLYIWWMRGTPLLMQLFLIYYGLPQAGITLDPFPAAAIGMTLNASAYIAEIFRGGILSIDKGQTEAARSLGMTYMQSMRWVIFPQTLPRIMPPLGNEAVARLKDSSLVSTIAMVDLMRSAQQMIATTFRPLEVYFAAGILYLLLTSAFTVLFGAWERRLAERSVIHVRPAARVKTWFMGLAGMRESQ
jgi:polar amino acid transport system permease protein